MKDIDQMQYISRFSDVWVKEVIKKITQIVDVHIFQTYPHPWLFLSFFSTRKEMQM